MQDYVNQWRPKRPIPDIETLNWREGYLSNLRFQLPVRADGDTPNDWEPGNKKTGQSGSVFASVFVWNLPAVVTCPAATKWCMSHCYNADSREDIFPVRKWAVNWWWVINRPDALSTHLLRQLASAEKPRAARLHSSGDFFSVEYIIFWLNIVRSSPETSFWAYTRSWACDHLSHDLSKLAAEPNMQLFASWDDGMPSPPANWRQSLVVNSLSALRKCEISQPNMLICPEQIGKVSCCASCGFCAHDDTRGIVFYLH